MHAQDTCELFFKDVRVPAVQPARAKEGMGFIMLMQELAWERLIIAIISVSGPKPRSNTPWNTPATARSSARLWLRSRTRASSWRR